MAKKMFHFIVLIRALAAMIITNAHYTGVYPTDLIANGGLLGDVLFFAVSGFCLASTNGSFEKWYLKRFFRIYIPTWVMTLIYIALGVYVLTGWQDFVEFFVWPTHWHFVASIIILYVPLFFVSKYVEMNLKNYWSLASGFFVIQLVLYLMLYDKSYYHIDIVREPMIEFLFFQSMLLGLHYRWKSNKNDGSYKPLKLLEIILCITLLGLYFASKMVFVKVRSLAELQIVNQLMLWGLLYILFDVFMKLEPKLHNVENTKFWCCTKFISDRTLEIYFVQYVILDYCKVGSFPINWIILTGTIMGSAVILRWLSQQIITRIKI